MSQKKKIKHVKFINTSGQQNEKDRELVTGLMSLEDKKISNYDNNNKKWQDLEKNEASIFNAELETT